MGSEVFVIRAPLTKNDAIIFGRNSFASCCKEICNFPKTEGTVKVELEKTFIFFTPTYFLFNFQCQNIEVSPKAAHSYILNGTCGANEKNVSIAVLFADKKPTDGLTALDLTK